MQSELMIGSRVHYSGDMANSRGWFTVSAVRRGMRASYDLTEIGGEHRALNGVYIDPSDPYSGHCAPRFVTAEAYNAWRAKLGIAATAIGANWGDAK